MSFGQLMKIYDLNIVASCSREYGKIGKCRSKIMKRKVRISIGKWLNKAVFGVDTVLFIDKKYKKSYKES